MPQSLLQFTGISEYSICHSQHCEELTPQIHWEALTELTHIGMKGNTEQYSPCACCEGTWGSEVTICIHSFLTLALERGKWAALSPATLPTDKENLVPSGRETKWDPVQGCICWRKLVSLLGIEHKTIQPVA